MLHRSYLRLTLSPHECITLLFSYSFSTLSFWSSLARPTAAMFHCLTTLPLNRIIFHHWVTTVLGLESPSSHPLFSYWSQNRVKTRLHLTQTCPNIGVEEGLLDRKSNRRNVPLGCLDHKWTYLSTSGHSRHWNASLCVTWVTTCDWNSIPCWICR